MPKNEMVGQKRKCIIDEPVLQCWDIICVNVLSVGKRTWRLFDSNYTKVYV